MTYPNVPNNFVPPPPPRPVTGPQYPVTQQPVQYAQIQPGYQQHMQMTPAFQFDGGAGSYFLVSLAAFLITALTFGLALPWAVCMHYQWQSQHTIIGGRRVRFTGDGASLFGHYIVWWFLTVITFGIYSFWLVPQMTKWAVEHQQLT